LAQVVHRVGSLVEVPALFPTFSARRNLELLAGLQALPSARIDTVIEMVGLTDRAKDLVRTYSLGMRQRLGIAIALLKDPELLILDEPANGLDPAGIKEVRQLLRRLASEGKTILVSSHILSEVQLMCDRVAILSRGRCVAQGTVDDVLHRTRASGVLVRVDDLPRAVAVLEAGGMTVSARDDHLRVDLPPAQGAQVARLLAQGGLYPSELRPDEVDLETAFLELTSEEGAASAGPPERRGAALAGPPERRGAALAGPPEQKEVQS
ncbi:MAG: ATP-binding cassette domain-containing protein, partial [Actinomycetota bacterium]|nr:ATP-binding cassette domain-containing protein [Actinomycetota bacterium]